MANIKEIIGHKFGKLTVLNISGTRGNRGQIRYDCICECGVKNDNLKLSDREWVCEACGLLNSRDLLAANNILKEGRRSLGDLTDVEAEVTKPVKRLESIVIN